MPILKFPKIFVVSIARKEIVHFCQISKPCTFKSVTFQMFHSFLLSFLKL